MVSSEISSCIEADQIDTEVPMFLSRKCDLSSTESGVHGSVFMSEERRLLSSDSDSGFDKDCLFSRLNEARTDAQISKHEAFSEELSCKKLELKVIEAVDKVNATFKINALKV